MLIFCIIYAMDIEKHVLPDGYLLGNEISKHRKLSKISQKDLADALDMTTAQLCKIEKGRNLTGTKILTRIEQCLALNDGCLVELRNQIAANRDEAHGQSFPSGMERLVPACDEHSIPKDALGSLSESVITILDEYLKAEESLGLIHFCRLNLGSFSASSEEDGIALAEEVRCRLNVGDAPLRDLLPILEQKNVRLIFVDDLPPIRANGKSKIRPAFSFYDRQYDVPVICINRTVPPDEQLYNIAYELAVCLRFRKAVRAKRHSNLPEWTFARAFASTLLMPTGALRDVIDALKIGDGQWSLGLLDDVALRFGVSVPALVWRLKSIGRISDMLFETLKRPVRRNTPCRTGWHPHPRQPIVAGLWLRTLQERTRLT